MSKSPPRSPRLIKDVKEDKLFKSRFDLNNIFKQVGHLDYREMRKVMVEG